MSGRAGEPRMMGLTDKINVAIGGGALLLAGICMLFIGFRYRRPVTFLLGCTACFAGVMVLAAADIGFNQS
jgi:hypothetical protein